MQTDKQTSQMLYNIYILMNDETFFLKYFTFLDTNIFEGIWMDGKFIEKVLKLTLLNC